VRVRAFLVRFWDKFSQDETTTLAASLAFYMALSLAPLAILFVAISSRFSAELQGDFIDRVRGLMGSEAAQAIEIVITGAKSRTDLTSVAGLFGVATILVSASLIFGQLRGALNRIFAVKPNGSDLSGVLTYLWAVVQERLAHIGMALIFILTLIGSLLLSSFISASLAGEQRYVVLALSVVISFFFYAFMFTFVFRYLPDRHQPWRSAFRGGLLTAILFEVGKELLGVYLGRSAIGSAYGAAGSLIVLLVWVYYSTLITFVGAQVSSLWGARTP
jgi:membrane protein